MPMVSSTRHKTDRICPQGPRAAAECLKCSFTKGRKERSHVEREKGRKDGGKHRGKIKTNSVSFVS